MCSQRVCLATIVPPLPCRMQRLCCRWLLLWQEARFTGVWHWCLIVPGACSLSRRFLSGPWLQCFVMVVGACSLLLGCIFPLPSRATCLSRMPRWWIPLQRAWTGWLCGSLWAWSGSCWLGTGMLTCSGVPRELLMILYWVTAVVPVHVAGIMWCGRASVRAPPLWHGGLH